METGREEVVATAVSVTVLLEIAEYVLLQQEATVVKRGQEDEGYIVKAFCCILQAIFGILVHRHLNLCKILYSNEICQKSILKLRLNMKHDIETHKRCIFIMQSV